MFLRLSERWHIPHREIILGPSDLSPNDSSAPPGHLCSTAAPPSAAAPPPLLHVDQQPSPSCCHPTTHLRQAGACLELPTTVQQPLLQCPPPLPLPRSDHPPQPSPTPPLELLPYSAPRPYLPLQPRPVPAPLFAANPRPQAVVPSSLNKEEEELLDILPSPPAVFSPSCNPTFSRKKEFLLEEGIARERTIVEEERSTSIMKETNLHSSVENGLMGEVVNRLHQVTYPSVMVYALPYAEGSKITGEVAWVIFDEVHHVGNREKDVVWQGIVVKVRWKENQRDRKV